MVSSERPEDFLKKVKPLSEVKKIKISEFRHPCQDKTFHRITRDKINTVTRNK